MFVRVVSLFLFTSLIASSASAQSRRAHPAENARAAASRERATTDPLGEAIAPRAPRPTYVDRRFRASVAFRSGIFAMPEYDLGFVSLGVAIGFGAQISDEVAILWEVSAMLGSRPVDETADNEDDLGPTVDVNLAVAFSVRRQVARRYFDVGPTLVNHWLAADGQFAQLKLGGGMRFGAGAFLMRKSGRRARTLGGELRIERVAEAPSLTAEFRWGAAF